MKRRRDLYIGVGFVTLLVLLFIAQNMLDKATPAEGRGVVMAPRFEVDPMWPKPLPNHWYIGMSIGVAADAQDHIWIVHRPDTVSANEAALDSKTGACCSKAPPVLEFDQAGNLIGHWGGPEQGYDWPDSNHGITIDYKGNVWIGGNGTNDAHVLKFTQDGKFLAQFGHKGKNGGSNDTENFGRVAKDRKSVV